MTTGSGKKTPKNPKTPKTPKSGKASVSRSRRKKVVETAPAPAAIDKDKMAAFFSAAGIENNEAAAVKEVKGAAVKEREALSAADERVATTVEISVPDVVVGDAVASPVSVDSQVVAESDSGALSDINPLNDNDNEKGEPLMTATSEASGNGSGTGSSNILSMFFVLVVLALFWFYFISSTPLKKAAELEVEQGRAEISTLMTKLDGLKTENSELKSKLVHLKKIARKWKKAAKKGRVPVSAALLPAEKGVAKAAPNEPAEKKIKRGSSFDKAPIPFWRNMRPRGSLIKQAPKKVQVEVKVPAAKVDSFSRAPKPFWLTPRVKPGTVKAEKQVIISAPPAVKCPSKYRQAKTKKEPVPTPTLDPSFDKAPKPFWLK